MYVAKQKRRENIAEYILYLWQLEDLLRALEFSPEKIAITLVEPYPDLSAEQQNDLLNWYLELCTLLKIEGKLEIGHLEHTLHLIAELNDLHLHLLTAPVGKEYAPKFAVLQPELSKLRAELKADNISDIELCFRALYSVILCRLKGMDQVQYVTDVLEVISPVVANLATIYRQGEEGLVDLYKEE